MKEDFLYVAISNNIARLIRDKVLKAGDRLPSVRMLCQEHGIGMNTAKRVFLELEARSLIQSKPQAGYFVSQLPDQRLPLPAVSSPSPVGNQAAPGAIMQKVYATMGMKGLTHFSIGVPSKELLPLAKLNKAIVQATRQLPASGTEYEQVQGNEHLRRMIAARSITWGGQLRESDIITTAGGMNALSFCLLALAKPGDTIALESPCYPGSLQLAASLGLKVLELPTHPTTGVSVDALKKVVKKIDLCLLVPNFNTPLGSCMPVENKKEVVALLARHQVPLIEDDIYGDLYFGTQRPQCCKTFDKDGNVLLCSSFSKTLAPGYRVGWVAPGRYKEQLLKLKHVHAISSTTITQEAVAGFLQSGRYDLHLRKLRLQLQQHYLQYVNAIAEYFPPDTKVSRPQGGLAMWVEFNKMVNTTELFDTALKQKISIAPGSLFTLQPQFSNCMRLSLGLPVTADVRQKLRVLGRLVTAYCGSRSIMKCIVLAAVWMLTHAISFAQPGSIVVKDKKTNQPLPGVTVVMKGMAGTVLSDSLGLLPLPGQLQGKYILQCSHTGYAPHEETVALPLKNGVQLTIYLQQVEEELEEVQVTATRSSRSIHDIPTRIETISAGELHEKAVMQPGNIRMLLTESTGIQTQQTSAVSGSASIRIQGLDGRYTLMLKDGFPLYSGFSGGLSILQIPPLDLKRVEVIKGSSSTLYGGGAIAGLVNLVTKVPTDKHELSLLANANQTGALDLNAFYGQKFKKFGVTVFATRNTQKAYNNNGDAFSDIPRFTRYTLNPKLFYYPNASTTVSLGLNSSFENRLGGDMQVIKGAADAVHSYFERNKTDRHASQFKLEKRFANGSVLTLKNSIGHFNRVIELPGFTFSGRQNASFSEISYLVATARSEWVTGLSVVTDRFRQTSATQYPLDYNLVTSGVFVQNNWKATEKFVLETGLRMDYTNQHDLFALPRISAMYKFDKHFTSRIGAGLGYKAPGIFSEEAEARSFRNIQPLALSATKPERSTGYNVDINYKGRLTDEIGITVNQLFFYTRLKSPLLLDTLPLANGNYAFHNADGYLTARGFETNLRLVMDEWSLYLGYTYTDAQRDFSSGVTVNPLTAKHRINCNVMYEVEDKWRIAYELFYTGRQELTNGEKVRDYWVMGMSGERRLGCFSLFVNFENFLDTRQSRWEPMYTGTPQHPNFREIYTPIDGFIFNGGFRVTL